MKVFAIFEQGPRELVDTARTSDNGGFTGIGDFEGATEALAKVRRKNIGGSNHRHICGKASDRFANNSMSR